MRRRVEKATIPEPFVSMRELAAQYRAEWARNHSLDRMADDSVNGRSDGNQLLQQGD